MSLGPRYRGTINYHIRNVFRNRELREQFQSHQSNTLIKLSKLMQKLPKS